MLSEPEPEVRFSRLRASSLDFTLICHVREVVDQLPVQHELHKRIFQRFKQESIEIPFPTRTVYIKEPVPGKTAQ
jgi:small-conductance mechanosensitive channel